MVAMVDSGVPYNFVATRKTTILVLKLSKDDNKLKVVNSYVHET